jgi:hypothetical protein
MRIAFAALLFVHGFAHLPGFLVNWQITEVKDLPYKTTILSGSVDLGGTGIRILGVFWLLAAIAFAASGIGVLGRLAMWNPLTLAVLSASLLLSLICWPDSRLGVVINVAIGAFLLLNSRFDWLV